MSRILLLGGSGFVGHHIVRELLSRGEEVTVLVRPESDLSLLSGMDVQLVEGDLERSGDIESALDGADALVHAAAYYPVYSLGREEQVKRAVKQIGRIHKALARKNVRRFLYVSTLSAVGVYPDGRPEDENAPYPTERYKSTYATLKRAMQEEVSVQAARFNSVLVAPTGVFGEGDRKPTTGRVILDVARGRIPIALKGKTNAVDARQVAWGIAEALARGKTGRLYVLGGENMTLEGFLSRISRILGVKPPRLVVSPNLVLPLAWTTEIIGKLFRARKPLLPVVGVDFARFGVFISSDLATRDFGYDPKASTVDNAIRRAAEWFRAHGYL